MMYIIYVLLHRIRRIFHILCTEYKHVAMRLLSTSRIPLCRFPCSLFTLFPFSLKARIGSSAFCRGWLSVVWSRDRKCTLAGHAGTLASTLASTLAGMVFWRTFFPFLIFFLLQATISPFWRNQPHLQVGLCRQRPTGPPCPDQGYGIDGGACNIVTATTGSHDGVGNGSTGTWRADLALNNTYTCRYSICTCTQSFVSFSPPLHRGHPGHKIDLPVRTRVLRASPFVRRNGLLRPPPKEASARGRSAGSLRCPASEEQERNHVSSQCYNTYINAHERMHACILWLTHWASSATTEQNAYVYKYAQSTVRSAQVAGRQMKLPLRLGLLAT